MRIAISHPAARAAQAVALFSRTGAVPGSAGLGGPYLAPVTKLFRNARLPVDIPISAAGTKL